MRMRLHAISRHSTTRSRPWFRGKNRRASGFALVVTVSLMILLTMLALGLLSLSAISLRGAGQSAAISEARANARLAMMLALGELQKQAGPDQQITANGSIVSDNAIHPNWTGVWGQPNWLEDPDYIELFMLDQSDLVSFHTCNGPGDTRLMVEGLAKHGRPIPWTEYMSRGNNSTFQGILPVFHEHKDGAYNWALVDDEPQTIYPWDSWKKKSTTEPDPWFHDVFSRDGTPYQKPETEIIRRLGTTRCVGFSGTPHRCRKITWETSGRAPHA